MSSNRTEARSIATQLVLLFTLCAALLLSCGLGVFYWIVVRHAFEEDNAVLADKLAAIRTDLKQPNGIDTVDRELKNRRAGEPVVYWMRIIDPSGNVVIETPGMNLPLPPNIFAPPQTSIPLSRSTKDYQKDGKLFSLVTINETVNGQPYLLQIAQDRSADERFRKQFGVLLALALGLGFIASTLVAITVTKRGLRPLAEMRHALERVQPAYLSSPPIWLTNYERQLETCSVKRKWLSVANAVPRNIAPPSNRPPPSANAFPESLIICFFSPAPNPPNKRSSVRSLTGALRSKRSPAFIKPRPKIDT